jgi:predicted ribosome quality control (RQC) complex YloA/Tae2 family protein
MITINYDDNTKILIGQTQHENDEIIDQGDFEDFWVHASDNPSCHVVITSNDYTMYTKKEIRKIITRGACLCKSNTSKLKNEKNVKFIYTKLKNVDKTDIPGQVVTINTKFIIL